MKNVKLRMKSVVGLVTVAAAAAANAVTVNVTRYWDCGNEASGVVVADTETSDYNRGQYTVNAGAKRTFYAKTPEKGKEVVAWSYGTLLTDHSQYSKRVETKSLSLDYVGESGATTGLGVHYDWLTYEVSFTANGGSGTMARQSATYPNTVTLKNGFTRTGYTFAGWSTTPAAAKTLADGVIVKGSDFPAVDYAHKTITAKALWKPIDVTVTFDSQGGSVAPATKTFTYDSQIPELPVPEREGYDFVGWYFEPEGRGGQLTWKEGTTSTYTKDFTVYAYWTIKRWKLTLGSNPGSGRGSVSVWPGTGTYDHGTEVKLTATAETGSRFTEWTDGVYSNQRTIVMTGDTELTARFDKLVHTVTFHYYDENDELRTTTQDVMYGEKAVFPSRDIIDRREDYHFTMWDHPEDTRIESDQVINAEYALNTYTIRFEKGVAPSGGSYEQSFTVKETKALRANAFTWTGHELSGWSCEALQATFSDEQMINSPLTHTHGAVFVFVAGWTGARYTVTLDPGSEGTVSPDQKKVTFGESYGTLPTPERVGYDFLGWFTTSGGGTEITSESIVETARDHDIYAHWKEKTYTVRAEGVNCTVSVAASGTFGTSLRYAWTLTDEPGYKAKLVKAEVYAGEDESGEVLQTIESGSTGYFTMTKSTGYAPSIFIKVEAEEIPNTYTVYFDPGQGSATESWRSVTYKSTYGGETGKLPTATRDGYSFTGWWTASTGGTKIEPTTVFEETDNQTVYAQWRALVYTFEFHGGADAVGEMAPQEIPILERTKLNPVAFAQEGYTFMGWDTSDAAATVVYNDQQTISAKSFEAGTTVSLFAVWKANTYTVSFFANGGDAGKAMSDQTFTYDSPLKLSACTWTCEGKTFKGWTTDPATATVAYTDKEEVKNLTSEPNGVVRLYAVWQAEEIDNAYSRAADCATDVPGDHKAVVLTPSSTKAVTVVEASDSYIMLKPDSDGVARLTLNNLFGSGSLTFEYTLSIEDETVSGSYLQVTVEGNTKKSDQFRKSTSEFVTTQKITKESKEVGKIDIIFNNIDSVIDYACIDHIKWVPDEWDTGSVGLTFRLNDGTPAPADIVTNLTKPVKTAIGTLPTVEQKGFRGWATSATAETPDVTESWLVPTTDTTLYALWENTNPEPTEKDRPVITADFSFKTDSRFDYIIKSTTSLLAPIIWSEEKVTGTGEPRTLPMTPTAEYPQRFFKVEVIQRQ